jgi:hypothetical protein
MNASHATHLPRVSRRRSSKAAHGAAFDRQAHIRGTELGHCEAAFAGGSRPVDRPPRTSVFSPKSMAAGSDLPTKNRRLSRHLGDRNGDFCN